MSAPSSGTLVQRSTHKSAIILRLNLPRLGNALNSSLVQELETAFDDAVRGGASLIVFSGTGKHFCAGFDLSDLESESDGDLLHRLVRVELLLQRIDLSPVVTATIAAGRIVGAGADLLVACDHRICIPGANIEFPGASFGLVLGSDRLAARVGRDKARDILTAGRVIACDEAKQMGLASEIAMTDEVDARIARMETEAARLDAKTLALIRQRTARSDPDGDLAALVRSAAEHGLKSRMQAYRARRLRKP